MNMEQAFQTFIAESQELLQDMEDKLVYIENSSDLADSINSIFRAAHTIKGSAGLFGLDAIVSFTHVVESVLDHVRSNVLPLNEDLINLMLKCKDHIGKLIDGIDNGQVCIEQSDMDNETSLREVLSAYLSACNPGDTEQAATVPAVQPVADNVAVISGAVMNNDNWHISVHFGPEVLRNGMDPLSFLRYLGKLGRIENIITLYDAIPPAADMDPESCYLAYEINFQSDADKATIENVFEFVRDDCHLQIIPPHARAMDFIQVIDSLANEELKLGEILVRCGTLTQRELDDILKMQSEAAAQDVRRMLGEIVVEDQLARPEVVEAALNKQAQIKKGKDKQNQTVRVDADKLDHLINLIGELVISGAGMESEVRKAGIGSMQEAALTMIRLIEEVRDGALNLRMVQIGDTFNRFQRVVRDVSKELGKNIELQVTGGETELDKTVIEKISDPLMHLVRNSVDHGIESPDVRRQRGKSETGLIRLNAYHESGSIVIEVSDDGGGLNRERILAKAVEKGLALPEQVLTDKEVYALIFEAGFSTAEQVSNISGRGVGMDVVRRNIEALRGTIEIDSESLAGTLIRIRLPLTLAIIDGFMMGVGDASFVVPLDIVEECMEMSDAARASTQGRNFINLRGEVLPFIRLRDHFRATGKNGKRENIVVVKYGSQKAGFVVDALLGEYQTVIKPLGALFEHLKGISGSTILGSGEVALILDAPSLIHHAMRQDPISSGKEPKLAALK